jgi:hypothetical protein
MTWRQGAFLKGISTGSQCAGELMDQRRMPWSTLDRWLAEPPFRRALRRRMQALTALRELEVLRAAEQGARCLLKVAHVETKDQQKMPDRQTCLDLIKLARALEAKKTRRPDSPAEPPPEQARILRELEQMQD